ncbi:MAG TPA: hypothetical protein VHO69_19135, partial [Phototrophicaceae bacterium]|nr:hypothetical protein [Phototrophicaceae bacterium]
GGIWLGRPDNIPRPLPDTIFGPLFLDNNTYIYATAPVGPFTLRLNRINTPESANLAAVSHPIPIFDALWLP